MCTDRPRKDPERMVHDAGVGRSMTYVLPVGLFVVLLMESGVPGAQSEACSMAVDPGQVPELLSPPPPPYARFQPPVPSAGAAACLQKLLALRTKALRKTDQDAIAGAGVIEAVLETMSAFMCGEAELQMAAVRLLTSIVHKNPVNQSHLRIAGATAVLLRTLTAYHRNLPLRNMTWRVLWEITRPVHDDQRPPPTGTGPVDSVIRAMKVSREDKAVQLEGCRALAVVEAAERLQQAEDAVLKACRTTGAAYDALSEAACRALVSLNGRSDLLLPFSLIRKVCKGFIEDQKTHIGSSLAFKGRLRGQDVVVKFVRDVYVYLKEVRALLRLGHANIEGIVGICVCAERQPPALVYTVCHGGTLAQHLYPQDGGPCKLNVRQRLRIAVDLARAVTYTHGKEQDDGPTRKRPPFFHRNIMSAFIGLDTAVPLTAKLLNFSSAVATEYLPALGPEVLKPRSLRIDRVKLLETEGHIAPEIREKAKFEARSDLYSIGMVLLELLTEKRIEPGTCKQIAKLTGKGRWPSRLDRQLAEAWKGQPAELLAGLKRICLSCIHPDESSRPASAWEVFKQLEELQGLLPEPTADDSEGPALPVVLPEERCCLCHEKGSRRAGLLCKEAEAYGHFTCDTCLPRYVMSQLRPALLRVHKGEIRCPHKDGFNGAHWCPAPKWSLDELRDVIGADVYRAAEAALRSYLVSCLQTHEDGLRRRDKWDRQKRAARAEADLEVKVGAYVGMVREDLLDLHCPNCWRVHHNWDACNALVCEVVDEVTGEVLGGCGAAFCPWCQIECVRDAHPHVREMHSGYWSGKPDDAKACCVRKNLMAFLKDIWEEEEEEGRDVPLMVLRRVAQDLKDVGVDPEQMERDLVGKRAREGGESEEGGGAERLAS